MYPELTDAQLEWVAGCVSSAQAQDVSALLQI
jgi:hypothetical protein